MAEFVTLETADGIGTIRLNRPPVNALNDQVTGELADAARAAESSDEIHAVIIYGGEKLYHHDLAFLSISDFYTVSRRTLADCFAISRRRKCGRSGWGRWCVRLHAPRNFQSACCCKMQPCIMKELPDRR